MLRIGWTARGAASGEIVVGQTGAQMACLWSGKKRRLQDRRDAARDDTPINTTP